MRIESGRVEAIHVAPTAGARMKAVSRVAALEGLGLAGDRYAARTGHWSPIRRAGDQLTLVEAEEMERISAETGVPLPPGTIRRNVTTRGIRLDGLIGQRFRIGGVECQAVRRCEPCTYLDELLGRELLHALVHRAGIRVEILTSGEIGVGDPIAPIDSVGERSR